MNRYKARRILLLSFIIYIFSYPFHKMFVGGLIYYGSSAALIGGLADWWGINRLLRKTIPKNKEKIFDGLSNMVSEELLTKENLKKLLYNYDMSKVVIEIVKNNDEFDNIKTVIKETIEDNLNKINIKETEKITSDLIINNMKNFEFHKLIFSVLENSIRNGYDNKIYKFVIQELKIFCETEYFKNILSQLIFRIKKSYEGDNGLKKIIDDMVIDEKDIFDKIKSFIDDLENENNIHRLKFKKWILEEIIILKSSEKVRVEIEEWKIAQLKNIKLDEYIRMILINSSNIIHSNENFSKSIINIIKIQLDSYIDNLNSNVNEQLKVNNFIKRNLNKWIDNGHENVAKTVKENLSIYDDTMLINLIESNVGNDLQLIRINGSLVGGIVGIIMFVIKYIATGV